MNALWTGSDFLLAIAPLFAPEQIADVTGISIDSRTLQKGEAFFAIKGENFDGHTFARKALEQGASIVVLEAQKRDDFSDLQGQALFVDDVLESLRCLARAARARTSAKIIAITGSVGKTSTKDALRAALAPSGKVHAAVSSFNNHWGVPVTLARMPQDSDYAIFEIGMNHKGEITDLVGLVRPDLAMITTIVGAHIGNFSSLEAIAEAKAEIFSGVMPSGVALINGDNGFADFLARAARQEGIEQVYRFGEAEGCDIRLEGVELTSEGSGLSLSLFGESVCAHLAAPGRHLAQNALAVLGIVKLVGGDVAGAAEALAHVGASKGRGEQHRLALEGGQFLLIDESYNANPDSMRAALAGLGLFAEGRKILVLGDMLELGASSSDLHAQLLDPVLASGGEKAFLSGPMMENLWKKLPEAMRVCYAADSADLIKPLISTLRAGDVVMVKGSLGSRMGKIVSALTEMFAENRDA